MSTPKRNGPCNVLPVEPLSWLDTITQEYNCATSVSIVHAHVGQGRFALKVELSMDFPNLGVLERRIERLYATADVRRVGGLEAALLDLAVRGYKHVDGHPQLKFWRRNP